MIWQALTDVVTFFLNETLGFMVGLLPGPVPWVVDGFDALGYIWGYLEQLEAWLPVGLAVTVATAVLAAYFVTWAIGLVKLIAGYLTLGGGVS